MKLHYEIGISQGIEKGTKTIDSGANLLQGLKDLMEIDDKTAFLDMWCDDDCLNMSITQKELREFFK